MSASSPSPNSSSLATPPPSSSVNASPPESPTPPSPLPPPPPPDTSPPPSASPPISASPPPVSSPPPPAPATSPPPPADAPPPSTPASPPLGSPTVPATPPTSPPPTTPSPPPPASAPLPETPNPPSAPPPSSPPPVPPSSSPPPPQSAPPPSSQTSPPSPNEPAPSPPTPTDPPSSHSPPPGQQPSSGPPPQSISPPPPTQLSPPVSHPSPPPLGTPSSGTPPSGNSTDSSGPSSGNSAFPVGPAAGVAGVVLLCLIGIIIWCMVKRKKTGSQRKSDYIQAYSHGSSPQPDISLIIKTEPSPPFASSGSDSSAFKESSHGLLGNSRTGFTYQELFEATNGFAPDNFLGEGGFGSVYKGVLPNGREVAVKQLKIGGAQGEREFKAEVDIISRIHHRHLVSLVGYCIFESRRLLVYDYMPNQTLHYHLHEENRPVLDWATRIKIALGAARGIAYLHEDCHPRIIHRDIKSSNILLDAKFEARVSDFGLAKLALDVDTHVSTRVMGTFGYMAPEYATSGKLTEKSDVYSYGVVLLELITGRRPVDESQPVGDESLVLWARPLLGPALEMGRAEGLVDPRLEKNYVENELLLMIEAAAACVRHSASKRPRMRQVVRAFDGLSPADLSNGMRVGESEIYDPAQQSAQMRWLRGMAFGNEDFSTGFFSDGSRSSGSSNPNPGGASGDPGPEFSTQQSRNHPSQQPPTQNIYFSSQRAQNPTFSGQSTTPDSSGQSSQNPNSSGHSSRNMDASSRESRNMESRNRDSSSRESQSS